MEVKMKDIIFILLILMTLGILLYVLKQINLLKSIPKEEKKPKLSKEQQKKQEELRKHFENLMGYDYDEALRGDKKAD